MTRLDVLYWDTSVFLCFLNKVETERREICEDILRNAKAGKVRLLTSTYTIAEVIRPKSKSIPGASRLTADQIQKIEGMFRWKWIQKIDVDQRVAFKAVELARDYDLLPADAVHAASAILENVTILQQWDRDFCKVAQLISVQEPKMISKQPALPGTPRPIGPRPEDFTQS